MREILRDLLAELEAPIGRRDLLGAGLTGLGAASLQNAAAAAEEKPPAAAVIKNESVPVVGDAAQLFVDLDRVEQLENARQVFHAADKHPQNPVLHKEKPWEHDRGTWGSVSYDAREKLFKVWYGASSGRQAHYAPGSPLVPCSVLCYAVSEDGIRWRRPDLGLYEVMGTRKNNIVIPDDHHDGMDHWESVLIDPLETDPKRRYKALGWSSFDWNGPLSGIYSMTSPDGLHWTHSPEPLFRFHPRPGTNDLGPIGDAHSLMIDTLRRRYVAYLRRLPHRAMSVSTNFIHWTPPRNCIEARPGEVSNTIYDHMGFVYGDRYLGLMAYFDRDKNNPLVTIRLITSRDGEKWQRPDTGRPFIDVGEIGSFDRFTNLLSCAPPIRVKDKLYIYYRGLANRHGIDGKQVSADTGLRGGELGLATLRVDGFASIDAAHDGGRVTTKPMLLSGSELRLNAKADFGAVTVEILDQAGQPFDGFARSQCQPLHADRIDHSVRWTGKPSLAELKGKPIRLRFHLENARLYSFRVQA